MQHDNVREHNRLVVLQALRSCVSASRAELARDTGLSVPTVATIATELTELGVLCEGELAPSAGGRPARLLQLVSGARNVLVLDLSGARLRAGRVDLLGGLHEVCAAADLELGPGAEQRLISWTLRCVAAEERAGYPISALALAVPGVVDPASGRVRLAPALGWNDVPVGAMLSEATGLPVLLENDVNAVALGELLHGAAQGRRNVVYLVVAGGIGAALVVDGALYRGANAAAGEIGYSLLPGLPEQGLDLGASGPFERHLLKVAEGFLVGGRVDLRADERRAAFEQLVEEVRLTLHNLACVLDPELVVVSWAADPEGELARAVAERWAGPLPVEVRAGSLGEAAALRGLGQLALERLTSALCGLQGGADWAGDPAHHQRVADRAAAEGGAP